MRSHFRICYAITNQDDVAEILESIPDSASDFRLDVCFIINSRHVPAVLDEVADRVYDLKIIPVSEAEPEEEGEEAGGDTSLERRKKRKYKKRRPKPGTRRKKGVGREIILRHIRKSTEPVNKSEFSPLFTRRGLSASNVAKILRELIESKEIQKVGNDSYKRKENEK